MTRAIAILAAAMATVGLAVMAYVALRAPSDRFADCRATALAGGTGSIGGPFTLVNGDGNTVTDADVVTRPTLVYFGYSFCPDVCPIDLSRNALAAAELAEDGIDVGQIFITVDPERDTPQVMREYSADIDPALVGLSGSPDQVAAAAKAYKVYFARSGDDPEFYLMDHSSFTYLVAPGTGFLEFYRSETSPEEIAASAACFVDRL